MVFGWALSWCAPVETPRGTFVLQTTGEAAQTCRSERGVEVCAWIERAALLRFVPKGQSNLYRGVQITEGRSIRLPDGFLASFVFDWNGPEALLFGEFAETHEHQLAALEADLSAYGVDFSENRDGAAGFASVFEPSPEQSINEIVARSTCGSEIVSSRGVLIPAYPTHRRMLDCFFSSAEGRTTQD